MKSLNLIKNYLHNGKRRVKVGGSLNLWRELLYGVPQGWILGPFLFIFFFFCNLFKRTDTANYVNNTTPCNANLTQELIINKLEEPSFILFKWFNNNFMKGNSVKSYILMSENKKSSVNIDDTVWSQRMCKSSSK